MELDLHVHTAYSRDASITIADLLVGARLAGLRGLAVTDHDEWRGALKAARLLKGRLLVIPGVELTAAEGHVILLGISPDDARWLARLRARPILEILDYAADHCLVPIIPHPLDVYRHGIGRRLLEELLRLRSLLVEAYNAASPPFMRPAYRAWRAHLERSRPPSLLGFVGGSDAHVREAIGLARTLIPDAIDPIEALHRGLVDARGRSMGVRIWVRVAAMRLKRKLMHKWAAPGCAHATPSSGDP